MAPGLKIWLWAVMLVNVLNCIFNIVVAIATPARWIIAIANLLIVLASAMILFQTKRVGFYFLCLAAIIWFIGNTIIGPGFFAIIWHLIVAILLPFITYLLLKNNWHQLS